MEVNLLQQVFPMIHHTRAASHFSTQKGNGIAVYKLGLPHGYAPLYFQLYRYGNDKIHARKQVSKEQQDLVSGRLDHATQSLIFGKRIKSPHEKSDASVTSSNDPNTLGFASVGWSKSTKNVRSSQPSISSLMEHLVHSNIFGNKNSQIQIAIADLFHCENIQDRAVKFNLFATLLAKA